jgi:hypothetical protein
VQASGEPIEVGPEVLEMVECDAQQIGTVEPSSKVKRAVQDVPPAVRRLVVRRDQGRCQVPGCSHTHFVDLHHIEPRADGGNHDPDTLILLCGAHHHAAHRGEISISGRVSAGVRFRHADGSEYGGRVVPQTAETRTKVFRALRGLGFRESHVKAALERVHVVHEGKNSSLGFEPLFRRALAVLAP